MCKCMSCAFAQSWCSMHTCILKILKILCLTGCVCIVSRKCKASKMAGAGLLHSPLPVVEDGSMGLSLCDSESPFSIPGSECPLRATRHHNNKWPESGNCAAATLSLTSYSSRTCKNMTPLGNQACTSRLANGFGQGPVCLQFKSSFQL